MADGAARRSAEAPIAAQVMMVAPVEAPAARAAGARACGAARSGGRSARSGSAAASQRPLVDENDWRVSRPPRPAVRTSEPVARPVAARPAAESRSPNLFQRITGAFATPKPATAPIAPPVEPSRRPRVRRAENVVAVAPKPAPRPAPAQASINLDVTERAKPARDDDDLQIPAFLRRQAN